MVDFNKKLSNPAPEVSTNPVDIYESLDRQTSKVGPLRTAQQEVLTEWYKQRLNEKDVILKLNTGAGKTIVGLLMLESKRRLFEKKGDFHGIQVFAANDNNLIAQTIKQAREFGLKVAEIDASNEIPVEVISGEKILVTSVQKIFNGLSIFGRKDAPDIDTIVIDDAHTSVDIIKQAASLKISKEKNSQLYSDLFNLLSEGIESQGPGTFADLKTGVDSNYNDPIIMPVPYWTWIDKIKPIRELISQRGTNSNEIKFTWPLIRDNLEMVNVVVSVDNIEITPIKTPIKKFSSFYNASQRIFMSATTSSDEVLILNLDISPSAINSPLVFSQEKWSGEKMVVIPSLISDKLTRSCMVSQIGKFHDTPFGITSIVPSFYKTKDWEKYGATISNTKNLQSELQKRREKNFDKPLVLVNKYDGIDLPDEQTRLLILDSLPSATTLWERYFENVVPQGTETLLKRAQKIEQGMGRSVRADTDYSVIMFIGSDLVRFIREPRNRKFFSQQTLKQIEIGVEISKDVKEEISTLDDDDQIVRKLWELPNQSIQRDEAWKTYYREQMDGVDYLVKVPSDLKRLIKINEILKLAVDPIVDVEQFNQSLDELIKYINTNEEKGWFVQLKAHVNYRFSKIKSKEIQDTAYKYNHRLLLIDRRDVVQSIQSPSQMKRLDNVINVIQGYRNFENFQNAIQNIISALTFGTSKREFESLFDELGKILGFTTDRPDENYKEGPDHLWAVDNGHYFVIEDKSEVKDSRKKIFKKETGQMNNSISWFKKHYAGHNMSAFLIIPTRYLEQGAGFADEVKIIRKSGLRKLKNNLRGFANEFATIDFNQLSTNIVETALNTHSLNARDFIDEFSEHTSN